MAKSNGELTIQQKVQNLATMLNSDAAKRQLRLALAKHMDPERMVRLAITAASKSEQLASCTIESIGLALLTASQIGIEPNGRDGHLVPFFNSKLGRYECQFIPDYKGLIRLAYSNPRVLSISGEAVYEHDEFDFEYGTKKHLRHRPLLTGERGEFLCAYAMVEMVDGQGGFRVMTREEIEKRRKVSQTGRKNTGPWAEWYAEQAVKTVVKSLSKFVPLGEAVERAIAHDNEIDGAIDVAFTVEEDADAKGRKPPPTIEQPTDTEATPLPKVTEVKPAGQYGSKPATEDDFADIDAATKRLGWDKERLVKFAAGLGIDMKKINRSQAEHLVATLRDMAAMADEQREPGADG